MDRAKPERLPRDVWSERRRWGKEQEIRFERPDFHNPPRGLGVGVPPQGGGLGNQAGGDKSVGPLQTRKTRLHRGVQNQTGNVKQIFKLTGECAKRDRDKPKMTVPHPPERARTHGAHGPGQKKRRNRRKTTRGRGEMALCF